MTVYPIPAFLDNYIWAIIDKKEGTFDCVDPGEAEPVLAFAKTHNLKLRTILLTHHHNDHIGGVGQLIKKYPTCFVYGPRDNRIPYVTHQVHANQTIQVGNYSFLVLSNPGHTSSHISYYEPEQGWLFCGDTLFSAGCGRVFDGTMEELHQSMLLFKNLPPTTQIFCAHEYTQQNLRFAQTVEPHNSAIKTHLNNLHQQSTSCSLPSTLDLELSINPFLRTGNKDVINYALQHGALSSESLEVFRTLRNQKNAFN
ncbi:hydroxyacylglutathione hydrolase [Legionella maioricensis]|uniref:Hydroxyacylglutathione hydrolase n=1 Tax=Legionella maioricensis TaxID=2896528 RepID=A0A9X2D226_9GAMM|nr:hydroxyacylglutathione hydrolase [Legionella maioricensis]MCL9684660.1 hydroxyacylglutathione hydrolase [Legionella maioricensis]MCL9687440.1 hydroxyacylglutathione hydrolase [Legionella maioricensis]